MKKQTAIEWLVEQIKNDQNQKALSASEWMQVIEQAKAMEKEQSISDYCEGFISSYEGWNGEYGLNNILDVAKEINAEQYYNQTYGGEQ